MARGKDQYRYLKRSVMNKIETTKTTSTDRMEFIEALSQEFLMVKGYGVYAHLSSSDVIRLFEQFRVRDIPLRAFIKEYVRSF
jgi:hypothetical protein